MELVDFLLARIAEDEAEAKHIAGFSEVFIACEMLGGESPMAVGDCEPERLLRECEAKRRIVEACGPFTDRDHWTDSPPSQAVRYLAVVYVNHPDYRQEWKP